MADVAEGELWAIPKPDILTPEFINQTKSAFILEKGM